ncbi:MAG: hypothetical protein ACOYOV_08985 [Bacteroidales bacterium]
MENQAIYEVAKGLNKKAVMVNYEEYDHVELTEEELKIAIYNAKKIKDGKLKEIAHWKKVNAPLIKMNYDENYNYFLNKAKSMIPGFKLDENNTEIFTLLCEYFSNENEHKGLLLCGPVGCGKTSLMKIFSENQRQSYAVVSARKPSYDFAEKGFEAIEMHSRELFVGQNKFRQNVYGCCFDDLGTEDEKKNYGNNVNVMLEIILNRYDKLKPGMTHLTSNMSAEQIKEVYGERSASRMREMFKMITFDVHAKDLRK